MRGEPPEVADTLPPGAHLFLLGAFLHGTSIDEKGSPKFRADAKAVTKGFELGLFKFPDMQP